MTDIRQLTNPRPISSERHRKTVIHGFVSLQQPAPTAFTDLITVLSDNVSTLVSYGPMPFPAIHGTLLPQQGDPVVMVVDDNGTPWVSWWGSATGEYGHGVDSFNGRTGAVTLTNADVTTAIGFKHPTKASTTSAQAMSNDVANTVDLNTVIYDPDGLWNLVSNCYMVPHTGYYQVNGHVTLQFSVTAGNNMAGQIVINDEGGVATCGVLSTWAGNGGVALAAYMSLTVSDILFLTVGHQIQLGVNPEWTAGTCALNVDLGAQNYLSIMQVA